MTSCSLRLKITFHTHCFPFPCAIMVMRVSATLPHLTCPDLVSHTYCIRHCLLPHPANWPHHQSIRVFHHGQLVLKDSPMADPKSPNLPCRHMATTYSGLREECTQVCCYQTPSNFKLLTYWLALWSFKTTLPFGAFARQWTDFHGLLLPQHRQTTLALLLKPCYSILTCIFLNQYNASLLALLPKLYCVNPWTCGNLSILQTCTGPL